MKRSALLSVLGTSLALLLVTFLALPAGADIVWFKNGKSMEGRVRVLPDGRVQVATSFGTMTFEAERVERIEAARTLDEIVREALGAVPPGDVGALLEIAAWCRDEGAHTLANELFQKVLALDPDQAEARRQLGYLRVGGRWLTAEEARIAAELVNSQGEWVSVEEQSRRLARERRLNLEERRLDIEQIAVALEAARLVREASREAVEEGGIPVSWIWVPGSSVGSGVHLPHRPRHQPSAEPPSQGRERLRERPQQRVPPGRQSRQSLKPPAP